MIDNVIPVPLAPTLLNASRHSSPSILQEDSHCRSLFLRVDEIKDREDARPEMTVDLLREDYYLSEPPAVR